MCEHANKIEEVKADRHRKRRATLGRTSGNSSHIKATSKLGFKGVGELEKDRWKGSQEGQERGVQGLPVSKVKNYAKEGGAELSRDFPALLRDVDLIPGCPGGLWRVLNGNSSLTLSKSPEGEMLQHRVGKNVGIRGARNVTKK